MVEAGIRKECTVTPKSIRPCVGCVLVATVLATTGPAAAQEQVRADLDKAARAVVSIDAKIGERTLLGAGVVAMRERDAVVVVTANHVVRQGATEARDIVVRFKDRPQLALAATLLTGFDKSDDLAAFRVERLREQGIDPCALPALPFATLQVVRRGHGVYPIGNPAGVAWRVPVAPDTVTEVGARTVTFQSALIDNGHSGGGLFNTFGDLVGIIRADQPPYGVATRADRAWALLRTWTAQAAPDACAGPAAAAALPARTGSTEPSPDLRALSAQAWTGNDVEDVSSWRPLFDAIHAGDVEAVRRLTTPAALDPDNYHAPFPLHWAAALGQVEVVKQLILMGAKKNAYVQLHMPTSPFGDAMGTPLHMAARANQVEAMKVLIRAGASLEEGIFSNGDSPGTPLATAARYDRKEAAQVLIDAGASLKGPHQDGAWEQSPIAQAVAHGHIDMIRLLLRARSPLSEPYSGGAPSLARIAVQHGQLETLRFLLSVKAPLECRSATAICDTPVHEALTFSAGFQDRPEVRMQALQILLAGGADPNGSNYTPYLQQALESHQLPALKLLLKAGARPNVKSREGHSMLALALATEDNDAASVLLAFGAKP